MWREISRGDSRAADARRCAWPARRAATRWCSSRPPIGARAAGRQRPQRCTTRRCRRSAAASPPSPTSRARSAPSSPSISAASDSTSTTFETGEPALDFIRRTRADLAIVNVYLKGKLGVEVTEEIRADPALAHTRVILIGALFRANRFRANPTNLYGADEYIEEQIPEKEFRQIIRKLFPQVGHTEEMPVEPKEYDEARRLARLILSDIVIYHPAKVEAGIRDDNFFDVLKDEIEEGRALLRLARAVARAPATRRFSPRRCSSSCG